MEYNGRRNGSSVERDAFRFMEAKLDYGKGSGTKRKLIKAELEEKFKDDAYKEAFNDALMNIDTTAIMRKIDRKKELEYTYKGVRKGFRLAKKTASCYSKNKEIVDFFLDLFFGGKNR